MNSVREFAFKIAEVGPEVVRDIASNTRNHYDVRDQLERGKLRRICEPKPLLKKILGHLDKKVLVAYPLPACVQSRRGSSALTNATIHVGQPWVVRLDIENFFPTITLESVRQVLASRFGYGMELSELVAKLTTLSGVVPQGAPTSPSLGNLVLLDADRELEQSCRRCGVNYSRWVDDLTFSGRQALKQLAFGIEVIKKHGFKVKRGKIEVAGSQKEQMVTGFVVNHNRPRLPARVLADIVARLVIAEGALGSERERRIRSLLGYLAYAQQAEPKFVEGIRARVNQL
jgi:RNA-directed DNA polymerase